MRRHGLSEEAIKETALRYQEGLICALKNSTNLRAHFTNFDEYSAQAIVEIITQDVDPSPRGIYTKWIVRMIATQGDKTDPFEMGDRTEMNVKLSRYDLVKPLIPDAKFRDINYFKTIPEFFDFMDALEDMDVRSIRQRDRDEELALLEQGGAKIIYDDDSCKVLQILSLPAAILFGRNTKWCVTMERAKHFDTYMSRGLLFYIILKGANKKERYAMAVPNPNTYLYSDGDIEFRNSANKYTSILPVECEYPDAMKALRDYYTPIVKPSPIADSIRDSGMVYIRAIRSRRPQPAERLTFSWDFPQVLPQTEPVVTSVQSHRSQGSPLPWTDEMNQHMTELLRSNLNAFFEMPPMRMIEINTSIIRGEEENMLIGYEPSPDESEDAE
jgi:hypothetical protein